MTENRQTGQGDVGIRTFTCIICPNGCDLEAKVRDGKLVEVGGAACPKGEGYVRQELEDPRRNIATSVLVEGGELPLASVRLTAPIPKGKIMDVMEEVKRIHLKAPVHAGQIVARDVLGLGSDVIATKHVREA